jgi:hypothetical protein
LTAFQTAEYDGLLRHSPSRQQFLHSQKLYFMNRKTVNATALAGLFSVLACASARAQPNVGERAAGMAGAFVAVADDASAVYWNPAGLATATFVSVVTSFGQAEAIPEFAVDPAGADRRTVGLAALSMPPLGLSYYHLGTYTAGPQTTAVPPEQGREEGRRSVSRLTTDHWGVTLLQSITQYFVVGGTVKLVRGEHGRGFVDSVSAERAVDEAAELHGFSESAWDVDVGAMVAVEHIRVGVVGRNLTTPEFPAVEGDAEPLELPREVRIGAAWGAGWPGISNLIVSVDADATRRATPTGDRRDIAGGVETWWMAHRIGVRGGVRGSTIGGARPVVTGGVSAGVTASIFIDAHLGRGDAGERSWGVGGRFAF